MAANIPSHEQVSLSQVRIPVDMEAHAHEAEDNHFDYHERAQWLRAAVLGATDGLVSVASLMMGVGAVRKDFKAMLLPGIAGLVAGACSMARGEFVSAYTQYDIAIDQMKREKKTKNSGDLEKEKLPNPVQAAFASALAFSVGGSVPLLGAAFIKERKMRLGLVVAVASLTLVKAWEDSCGELLCAAACWRMDGYGHYFWDDQVYWLYWIAILIPPFSSLSVSFFPFSKWFW